jgi:probable F420-dependent oxidoreductase
VKIDIGLIDDVSRTKETARALEAQGYDGLWVSETKYDPFLQLVRAADATDRIDVGSAVAIAFARTPMVVASTAYDLAGYAEGRFILGLGSQIKPHIERRFSMPWSHPAARMREFVLALRAIWACWHDGAKLDFQGAFYSHTLMTPFFAPDRHDYGPPPVYLAGVGGRMTEVAGEVADGFFVHPFTTARYVREVTIPALERGRTAAGKQGLDDFTISALLFFATGRDEAELAEAVRRTREQVAFYASTPSYRAVLELHGMEDLQPELTRLSKEGKWAEMGEAIPDELLHEMAVIGEPAAVGKGLRERWADHIDRITLYLNFEASPGVVGEVVEAMR